MKLLAIALMIAVALIVLPAVSAHWRSDTQAEALALRVADSAAKQIATGGDPRAALGASIRDAPLHPIKHELGKVASDAIEKAEPSFQEFAQGVENPVVRKANRTVWDLLKLMVWFLY